VTIDQTICALDVRNASLNQEDQVLDLVDVSLDRTFRVPNLSYVFGSRDLRFRSLNGVVPHH
jgi:hypothetical protein